MDTTTSAPDYKQWQGAIFAFFVIVLILNVIGFAVWSTEHDEKERILNIEIAVRVNLEIVIDLQDHLSAKTLEAQLRFIKAQTAQAYLSGVMFIAPLLVLFLSLTTDFTVINGELLAATRFSALTFMTMRRSNATRTRAGQPSSNIASTISII
ncbi:hypothetical protein PRIPAC_77774 [Pristionchus pacificus]|uniref:Uncharacterized protein n=1 Tax=Pristionchus pacificus TaxID=54126 RepID=A0A2A6CKH8_PRIPA|nr:hypothetical protein PRIPAC_77774 [Pristionchus pacificus]|eukprot:PDM78702.1 hypothetical protein PRIPAC_31281 [Pristionchus pacificus]